MPQTIRLYTKEPLSPESIITLSEEQTHYLKNVVKINNSTHLLCFDNKNGEFSAELISLDKKQGTLKILNQTKEYIQCPDIWLLFAPLKKDKTDFVIEKATELGCRKIQPVITQYTMTKNIRLDRYIAQSIEAAEQCRRTDLPEIASPQELTEILSSWDNERVLYFMDETLTSSDFLTVLKQSHTNKAALLIGPEGGFSETEQQLLRKQPYTQGATLGPRILRAETAVAAALSCWQLISGDWSK